MVGIIDIGGGLRGIYTSGIYDYLLDNNIPLIENGKINSIFAYQPSVILQKYGIDLKQLMEIYPYEERKDKNELR